ncbi:MAG: hypothetical protein LC808_33010, partial [Actinobacteria bacterium]|nr:hypothetical protein [Actinomycetota bacterium]
PPCSYLATPASRRRNDLRDTRRPRRDLLGRWMLRPESGSAIETSIHRAAPARRDHLLLNT